MLKLTQNVGDHVWVIVGEYEDGVLVPETAYVTKVRVKTPVCVPKEEIYWLGFYDSRGRFHNFEAVFLTEKKAINAAVTALKGKILYMHQRRQSIDRTILRLTRKLEKMNGNADQVIGSKP